MANACVVKAVQSGILSIDHSNVLIKLLSLKIFNKNGDARVAHWLENDAMKEECPLFGKCSMIKESLSYTHASCFGCPQSVAMDPDVLDLVAKMIPNMGSINGLKINNQLRSIGLPSPELVKDFGEKDDGNAAVPLDKETMTKLMDLGVEFSHPNGIFLAMIPWRLIDRNDGNPRKTFDKDTIKLLGKTLITSNPKYANNRAPVVVHQRFKPKKDEYRFILEDGERRWRGAQDANTDMLFCIVMPECDDVELLVNSCLANFCRENLNLWDSACAFQNIMNRMNWTAKEVASRTGLHEQTVYNALKLLKLHPDLKKELDEQTLDPGNATYFISWPTEKQPSMLAKCRDKGILKKGKKGNPNNFSRTLKKVAREMDIEPVESNRGSTVMSLEDSVFAGLDKKLKALKKELAELLELTPDYMKQTKKMSAKTLAARIEFIIEQLQGAKAHLEAAVL